MGDATNMEHDTEGAGGDATDREEDLGGGGGGKVGQSNTGSSRRTRE